MSWSNLALWNVQIALLAVAAAALAAIFRLRPAPARLVYWQALLALCLVLPAVQPWRQETVVLPGEAAVADGDGGGPGSARSLCAPRAPALSWPEAVAALLAAGILVRAGWFGLGLLRLARYRRTARVLHPLPEPVAEACRRIGVYPEIALSEEVSGPVTFGFRDPVILFPARFPDLDREVQSAVASHELLHVRRRDWLFTAIEEMVRAVFWFHPAVWWVLGQIQLAREQSVDREVVKLSQTREQYVDALLAFSGARSQLDLAPAPLFLRRRHLTARVSAILKEADMSRRILMGTLAACAGGLLLTGWLVCARLPLQAAPQYVQDAPGVTVTGADRMMHRNPVPYPAEAREKNIEGTLVLDVVVAADGTVTDATVLSGPAELRASTLKSVLGWHFRPEAAGRQQVIVEFMAGAAPAKGASPNVNPSGELAKPLPLGRVLIRGLSQAAEADLRGRLSLQENQVIDNELLTRARQIVRDFDPNLMVSEAEISMGRRDSTGAPPPPMLGLMIAPTGPVLPEHAPAAGPTLRNLSSVPQRLASITIMGIPPEAAEELRRRLPVKEGDAYDVAAGQRLVEAVKAYDPSLRIVMQTARSRRPAGSNDLPEEIEIGVNIAPAGTPPAAAVLAGVTLKLVRIDIQGIAPDAAEELRRRLPVKEGDTVDNDSIRRLIEAARAFDPHLGLGRVSGSVPRQLGPDGRPMQPQGMQEITLEIRPMEASPQAAPPAPALPPPPPGVMRIRVGGNVQQAKLRYQVRPVYPDMAKQARVQGVVRLSVLIDTEGKMKNISVIGGHPLLVPAAMEAVKQWQYETTLLNGAPAEVVTQVDINFTLSE